MLISCPPHWNTLGNFWMDSEEAAGKGVTLDEKEEIFFMWLPMTSKSNRIHTAVQTCTQSYTHTQTQTQTDSLVETLTPSHTNRETHTYPHTQTHTETHSLIQPPAQSQIQRRKHTYWHTHTHTNKKTLTYYRVIKSRSPFLDPDENWFYGKLICKSPFFEHWRKRPFGPIFRRISYGQKNANFYLVKNNKSGIRTCKIPWKRTLPIL